MNKSYSLIPVSIYHIRCMNKVYSSISLIEMIFLLTSHSYVQYSHSPDNIFWYPLQPLAGLKLWSLFSNSMQVLEVKRSNIPNLCLGFCLIIIIFLRKCFWNFGQIKMFYFYSCKISWFRIQLKMVVSFESITFPCGQDPSEQQELIVTDGVA